MCPQSADGAYASGWQQQGRWSGTASAIKANIEHWRTGILSLTILGAILETLAASGALSNGEAATKAGLAIDTWSARAGWVGTLALTLVPILSHWRTGKDRIQHWIRARSASEGLKSELYTFATSTPPYDSGDRELKLQDAIDAIGEKVADLATYAALVDTPATPPPPEMTVADYAERRIADEIKWYLREARQLARKLSVFRSVELGASVLAAVLAAIASIGTAKQVGAWVAVVTTATAAIMAHVAAERYEFRVQRYSSTASRLEAVRNRWGALSRSGKGGADNDAQFVRDCEAAISIENQGWMAELVRETEPAKPAAATAVGKS